MLRKTWQNPFSLLSLSGKEQLGYLQNTSFWTCWWVCDDFEHMWLYCVFKYALMLIWICCRSSDVTQQRLGSPSEPVYSRRTSLNHGQLPSVSETSVESHDVAEYPVLIRNSLLRWFITVHLNRSPLRRKHIPTHPTPSEKPQTHSDKHHSCIEWKTTLTPHLIWSLIFYRSDVHF